MHTRILNRLGLSSKTPFQAARTRLIGWGAFMAIIYLVYLIFFPLLPSINRPGIVLDIEMMLKDGRRWFAPLYALGLLLLFYAFWRVMQVVQSLSRQDPEGAKRLRLWVLGIGLVCGVILLGLYPITALDVALYVVRARIWALYGGSPLIAFPINYPQDPYITMAGEYAKEAAGYGPVWELVAQIPMHVGLLDMASGIIGMKLIALVSYVGMGFLLGWRARQEVAGQELSGLTMLTFMALNPLILLEAFGNGHNDMLLLALMTLGLVLWQRDRWPWAAFVLTLAALVKITGFIFFPLFGLAVLITAPDWRTRILHGLAISAIFLVTAAVAYRLLGPFPQVFASTIHAVFDRAGYTPNYLLRIWGMWFHRGQQVGRIARELSRDLFILVYIYLMVRMIQRKMTLVEAGFFAFFSQLLLGPTFRIWYPMWLVPFAALHLSPRMFWRTFLFALAAELSILMYYIAWRWYLRYCKWCASGPLKPYWEYWLLMTTLTVPWLFGTPLFAPLFIRNEKRLTTAPTEHSS